MASSFHIPSGGIPLNDVHSCLNQTRAAGLIRPSSLDQLRAAVAEAADRDLAVSLAGGRHAMGGQQFCSGGLCLDLRGLNRTLELDRERGLVTVEAGIDWTALLRDLLARQTSEPAPWTFRQKQTGANQLTIGGAVAANIHGRGLSMRPFVDDLESLQLLTPQGELLTCSRETNRELFRLVVGGYGLFGIVYSVTLRLTPRCLVQRRVRSLEIDDLLDFVPQQIRAGARFGDFQFAIDPASPQFLRHGIASFYYPDDSFRRPTPDVPALSSAQTIDLLRLAHTNPAEAFRAYHHHYRLTEGAVYWADYSQFSAEIDGYHRQLDRQLGASCPGSEMITEVYVPFPLLPTLMTTLRHCLHRHRSRLVYGTVRAIREDPETFLPWARQDSACVVLNLHLDHSPEGLQRAEREFRDVIDCALALGGSFYLTYHRFATASQLHAAYPEFDAFLQEKQDRDPHALLQSDWYRSIAARLANRQSAA